MEETNEVAEVTLKYEKLPEFCYACGKVRYARKDCRDEAVKQALLGGGDLKFGSWLRAFSEMGTSNFEGPSRNEYGQDRENSSEQECGSGVVRRTSGKSEDSNRGTIGTPKRYNLEVKQGNIGGSGGRTVRTGDDFREVEDEPSAGNGGDQWQGIDGRVDGSGENSLTGQRQEQSLPAESQKHVLLTEESRDVLETEVELMGTGLDAGRRELGEDTVKATAEANLGGSGGGLNQLDESPKSSSRSGRKWKKSARGFPPSKVTSLIHKLLVVNQVRRRGGKGRGQPSKRDIAAKGSERGSAVLSHEVKGMEVTLGTLGAELKRQKRKQLVFDKEVVGEKNKEMSWRG